MNLPDALNSLPREKQPLARELLCLLGGITDVCSVTLTGSFCETPGWDSMSDVDVVVICKKLTKSLFDLCVKTVGEIDATGLGVPCRRMFINTKFGPLKFDVADTLVIHLMVYDVAGHQAHVLGSPFTCYDWERSRIFCGNTLREVFPVLRLQPSDFIGARRGLENYLDDLDRGEISYRYYDFEGENPVERTGSEKLTPKQRGEYAFHIVRNTISNYAKLIYGENLPLKGDDFNVFWKAHLSLSSHLIPAYQVLEGLKLKKAAEYPANVLEKVREFLVLFHQDLLRVWGEMGRRRIVLMRHAKTGLNDGSFLGQGRDPEILDAVAPSCEIFEKVYASPLKRAWMTAAQLNPGCAVIADGRLLEEDYGAAEGLSLSQLKERYPYMISAWQRGEDPCFPNGENSAMVEARAFSFLDSLHKGSESPILVVTHNVVLRCWLGRMLGIARHDWHKLSPAHLEGFEVIVNLGEMRLNLSVTQRRELGRNLSICL